MSAIDWTPGPRLRAAMDADQALAHMQRDELGGWMLTVRRFGMRPLYAPGTTAQEAADAMERMMGVGMTRQAILNEPLTATEIKRWNREFLGRQKSPTLPTHGKKCTPEEDGSAQSACRSGGAPLSRAVN